MIARLSILAVGLLLVGCLGGQQSTTGSPTANSTASPSTNDANSTGPGYVPPAGFTGYGIAVVWLTGDSLQVNMSHSTCESFPFNLTSRGLNGTVNVTVDLSFEDGLAGNATGTVSPANATFTQSDQTISGSTRICAGANSTAGSAILSIVPTPTVPVTRGSIRIQVE